MSENDEAIIEAMARARCEAAGFDPDTQSFSVWTSEGEVVWPYAWHAEREPAAKQLAAHRAMLASIGLMQRDMVTDWIETTFPDKAEKEQGE